MSTQVLCQFFLKNRVYYLEVLVAEKNGEVGTKISLIPPTPTYTQPPPLLKFHIRVVHLLQ